MVSVAGSAGAGLHGLHGMCFIARVLNIGFCFIGQSSTYAIVTKWAQERLWH